MIVRTLPHRLKFPALSLLLLAIDASRGQGAADAVAEQVQRLLASQNWPAAQAMLYSAIAAKPGDAVLWNLRGILDASQGHNAEAEKDFSEAVRLEPRLAGAWLNLGRFRMLDSDQPDSLDLALAAFKSVLKLDPQNSEAHHQTALILQWKGEFAASIVHLKKLAPADQNRRSAIAIRCADEASLGHDSAALEFGDQLLNDPAVEEADVTSILPAVTRLNPRVALHLLAGLDSRNLASAGTRAELARNYENAGSLSDARRLYEAAFRAEGEVPEKASALLTSLARVAFRQKDFEGALGYLGRARELDANKASIHFFFGLTCNELRLPIEARKSLERAVALAPDNAYYNYALGAVLLQWKETDGALPYLLKYNAAEPQDPRGHVALAYAYLTMNRDGDAVRVLAQVDSKDEMRAAVEFLRARLAARRGDRAEEITRLRTVISLQPGAAEAHAELGASLLDQGDVPSADHEAQAALAIDPENQSANRTLMRLYRSRNDPRLAEQIARLKTLAERGDEEMRLLQRSVEVRPW
jgi:tetratricopeptide (TPR) repeat protein